MTAPGFDYDLIVIGAGSGGVRAARMAAQYGARVLIAEEYRVGGTCVIRGCVPKKLLVYASKFHEEFEDSAGFGWSRPAAAFDWSKLIANKDKEIDRLNAIYIRNLNAAGVQIVQSRAELRGANEIYLVAEERTLRGSYMGSAVPSRDIPRYLSLYRAGLLPVDRLLSHRLTLAQINEGFDRLASGEALRQVVDFEGSAA